MNNETSSLKKKLFIVHGEVSEVHPFSVSFIFLLSRLPLSVAVFHVAGQ